MIFHATDNANYEGIRERGLVLEAYAGGVTSPGPGTVVKYGPYVFYCNLDYESYLNHGHELTASGVKPPLTPRGQLDMRISLVTPRMERWMRISPSNKKS
eukprot:s4604_g7.t1